jgi:ribosome assembly protein 1
MRSKDPRAVLTTVFANWLPLSTALLVSVTEHLPSPLTAQKERLLGLIEASPGATHIDKRVREAMVDFKTGKDEPVVAYVSKMISVPESELPENRRRAGLSPEEARELGRKKRAEIARAQGLINGETPDSLADGVASARISDAEADGNTEEHQEREDREHLIGFARLYSGTLSVGDSVYVIRPKFSPAHPHASPEPEKVTITALYLLMGRSLEPLSSVPAGVVFGVAGLAGHILKSGTLCSQLEGSINLAGMKMGSQPIVRIALEPANPSDLDKMINGLRMLEQSDASAEYEQLESGEHVILTAGELHLERCLKDLRERFAKCDIQTGKPIVPYRETIIKAEEMAPPKNKDLPRGTVVGVTVSKQVTIRLRVRPLPMDVTELLNKQKEAIRRLYSERTPDTEHNSDGGGQTDVDESQSTGASVLSVSEFKTELKKAFNTVKGEKDVWAAAVDRITAFGPRRVGPNLLIDSTKGGICSKL